MNAPIDRQEHLRLAMEQAGMDAIGGPTLTDDAGWFRDHVTTGCDVCQEAQAKVAMLFEHLLLVAPEVEPPAALRNRLLNAVSSSQPNPPEVRFVERSKDEWQETGVPGVTVKVLNMTEDGHRATALVRLIPGATYPRHRHVTDEECYVLEGDCRVDGRVLRAGDYQFAQAGSVHGVQTTEEGCTLLVIASPHNEILS